MTMQQITAALEDIGQMSALELCTHLGLSRLATNKQIKQLRTRKAIHIARYERQPDGLQGRCIPVYALGDAADALPLPARKPAEINRRYYARNVALVSVRRYSKQRGALGVWAGLA